jgi:hypothetical protein
LLTYVQSDAEVFKSVQLHRYDLTSDGANVVHRECRPRVDNLDRAYATYGSHSSDAAGSIPV